MYNYVLFSISDKNGGIPFSSTQIPHRHFSTAHDGLHE
jgi:hypothetical protein